MKIAIDLGNKFVKAQTETGDRVFFRPVIAPAPARRQVFSVGSKHPHSSFAESESIQVSIGSEENEKNYYVGKLAERRGELPERVFGKEKYTTTSAEQLIWTALAMLVKDNEPVDIVIDFPYGQFDTAKNQFATKLRGKTETVCLLGQPNRTITIRSVLEYPQSMVAAFALSKQFPEVFSQDDGGYLAIVDIGGGTTDVVVFEVINGDFVLEEGISGTLQHGTHDLVQVIRRHMEGEVGELIDVDLADRIVEKGKAFYRDRTWNFPEKVEQTTANLASVLKAEINELFGNKKNRIHTIFWIGGGATLLNHHLQGFHFHDIFPEDPQWKNVEGCLSAETTPSENNFFHTAKQDEPQDANTSVEQELNRQETTIPQQQNKQHADTNQMTSQQHSVQSSEQNTKNEHSNVPKHFQEGARAW